MNDTITNTLLAVGAIWGITAAITVVLGLIDKARQYRCKDPWNCPQSCGVEYGYWCPHLAPQTRCPAVDEKGRQCIQCRGHDTDDLTWPGFAVGHTAPEGDS